MWKFQNVLRVAFFFLRVLNANPCEVRHFQLTLRLWTFERVHKGSIPASIQTTPHGRHIQPPAT